MLDLQLFHRVFHASANDLFFHAEAFLKRLGYVVTLSHEDREPDWLVASVPDHKHNGICLVAHLDTIIRKDGVELEFSEGIVRNTKGVLGADDRAGVYAILDLIQRSEHRPPIIFTNHEEIGGRGVKALVRATGFDLWVEEAGIKFFIELDRANERDYVYYSHDLPDDMAAWVERYGFRGDYGSYSDVADLTEATHIPHVNLSIGYRQQHGKAEWLSVPDMLWTQAKVWSMLYDPSFPARLLTSDEVDGPPMRSYLKAHGGYSYTGSYKTATTYNPDPVAARADADIPPMQWLFEDEEDEDEDDTAERRRLWRVTAPTGAYQVPGSCFVCHEYTHLHEDWMVCRPCLMTDLETAASIDDVLKDPSYVPQS